MQSSAAQDRGEARSEAPDRKPESEGAPGLEMARAAGRTYAAFMSYSRAADGRLAPALQSALQRFAKPWYRRQTLRVFRDQTSLEMTPDVWPEIRRAIDASEFFILLA